jgi:hypothetical protein
MVPILHDPTTNWSLAGSLHIALRPERIHSNAPKLFLESTGDVITEFYKFKRTVGAALALLLLASVNGT